MAKRRSFRPSACPQCGSNRVVRIVYGLPGPELMHKAQAGEVVLGGCCITANDPQWQCQDCRHRWRSTKTDDGD